MAEKKFADGMNVRKPSEKAPDFVKFNLGIRVADFVSFLKENQNESGWVNIDIKESQKGKIYAELNTYTKKKKVKSNKDNSGISQPEDSGEGIPVDY